MTPKERADEIRKEANEVYEWTLKMADAIERDDIQVICDYCDPPIRYSEEYNMITPADRVKFMNPEDKNHKYLPGRNYNVICKKRDINGVSY